MKPFELFLLSLFKNFSELSNSGFNSLNSNQTPFHISFFTNNKLNYIVKESNQTKEDFTKNQGELFKLSNLKDKELKKIKHEEYTNYLYRSIHILNHYYTYFIKGEEIKKFFMEDFNENAFNKFIESCEYFIENGYDIHNMQVIIKNFEEYIKMLSDMELYEYCASLQKLTSKWYDREKQEIL